MSTIKLDNRMPAERVKDVLSYEPESGVLTWRPRIDSLGRPNTKFVGQEAGTVKSGEIQVAINWGGEHRLYRAHHLAWAIMTGEWPSKRIDHKDGDPTNNRWSNFRLSTATENSCNRHVVNGSVPFKGVYFMSKKDKYAAQIKMDKQWSWLGVFTTAEAAAVAYDKAALFLHGDFATTNVSLGLLDDLI